MTIYSCDIEANGLLEDATKIHCLSAKLYKGEKFTYCDSIRDCFDTPKGFFDRLEDGDTLIWHNGCGYDLPLLEKLGIISRYNQADEEGLYAVIMPDGSSKQIQIVDTLALSREYWPDNPRGHGLHAWAKFLGTFKPEIEDWHNLPIEEYIDRCENDVITTEKVFLYLADKLGIEIDD